MLVIRKREMDNNICSGPEITRKTLIDQLFISVIHVKQNLSCRTSDSYLF